MNEKIVYKISRGRFVVPRTFEIYINEIAFISEDDSLHIFLKIKNKTSCLLDYEIKNLYLNIEPKSENLVKDTVLPKTTKSNIDLVVSSISNVNYLSSLNFEIGLIINNNDSYFFGFTIFYNPRFDRSNLIVRKYNLDSYSVFKSKRSISDYPFLYANYLTCVNQSRLSYNNLNITEQLIYQCFLIDADLGCKVVQSLYKASLHKDGIDFRKYFNSLFKRITSSYFIDHLSISLTQNSGKKVLTYSYRKEHPYKSLKRNIDEKKKKKIIRQEEPSKKSENEIKQEVIKKYSQLGLSNYESFIDNKSSLKHILYNMMNTSNSISFIELLYVFSDSFSKKEIRNYIFLYSDYNKKPLVISDSEYKEVLSDFLLNNILSDINEIPDYYFEEYSLNGHNDGIFIKSLLFLIRNKRHNDFRNFLKSSFSYYCSYHDDKAIKSVFKLFQILIILKSIGYTSDDSKKMLNSLLSGFSIKNLKQYCAFANDTEFTYFIYNLNYICDGFVKYFESKEYLIKDFYNFFNKNKDTIRTHIDFNNLKSQDKCSWIKFFNNSILSHNFDSLLLNLYSNWTLKKLKQKSFLSLPKSDIDFYTIEHLILFDYASSKMINVESLKKPYYKASQLREIIRGIEHNINVNLYLNPGYDSFQMKQIRQFLEHGNQREFTKYINSNYFDYFQISELYNTMSFPDSNKALMQYNEKQEYEILKGLKIGIDISKYSSFKFDSLQMHEIYLGLLGGINVDKYRNPKYNYLQMQQIRLGLIDFLDVSYYANPLFSYEQMKQIRLGLKKNLPIEIYANTNYNAKTMYLIRTCLTDDLLIGDCIDYTFDYDQILEIAKGLYHNLSVYDINENYSNPTFSPNKMRTIRIRLEQKKYL